MWLGTQGLIGGEKRHLDIGDKVRVEAERDPPAKRLSANYQDAAFMVAVMEPYEDSLQDTGSFQRAFRDALAAARRIVARGAEPS